MGALGRLDVLKSGSFLNLSSSDFDQELNDLLWAATQTACTFTDRILYKMTYTDEYYSGDGTKFLYLKQWPVDSITTVKIWDGDDSYDEENSDYYTLRKDRYLYYPNEGETSASYSRWSTSPPDNIQVTYIAGYDTDDTDYQFDVPWDLDHAVCKLAALMWTEGRQDAARPMGFVSLSRAPEGVTIEKYLHGMPEDIERMLSAYRRVAV